MKKRELLTIAILFLVFLLGGCGNKQTAEKYVGEQITAMKEENASLFSPLLEQGIAESNSQYVLEFPEELKESYLSFLQDTFSTIEFEVSTAKKSGDDSYSVSISYAMLDVDASTKDTRANYLASMTSSDLTEAVKPLLESSLDALKDNPVLQEDKHATITVKKTEDGYSIDEKSMTDFLSQVCRGYMAPYDAVCEILDARDYMQSILDATFKSDVSQFAKHAGVTEEEASSWYTDDLYTPYEDMLPAYTDRYTAAMKTICSQCQYTVGIPKKDGNLFSYTIDVTVVPNNSLKNILTEAQSRSYYSEEEFDQNFIALMEKYAAEPAYGEETVITVPFNFNDLGTVGEEDSEYTRLMNLLLPVE